MTDPGRIPDPVQWHEGMLLSPQHFQLAAQRNEALLAYHLGAARPLFWGVRRLAIDEAALLAGLFRITALEVVMPDGLLVLDQDDPTEPPLQIALAGAAADPDTLTITVHLAVAAAGGALAGAGARARYRSLRGPVVADQNTGDNEIEVPRLRPLAGLALTAGPRASPPGRQVAVPLARLRPADDGWELTEYDPPRPVAERGSLAFACGQRIARRLRAAALAMAERLQALRVADGDPPPTEAIAAARAMSRGLPRLETQLASGAAHPLDLYLTLCDIVGDLIALAPAPAPAEIAPYDHLDALPGFAAIERRVEAALGHVREPFQTIRFERAGEGRFTLAARAEWLDQKLIVGARVGPGQEPARVAAWMRAAIIATESRMRAAIENRTRGAERAAIAAAPEIGLTPTHRILLSRISVDPAAILPDETLLVTGGIGAEPGGEAGDMGEPQALMLFLAARAPHQNGRLSS